MKESTPSKTIKILSSSKEADDFTELCLASLSRGTPSASGTFKFAKKSSIEKVFKFIKSTSIPFEFEDVVRSSFCLSCESIAMQSDCERVEERIRGNGGKSEGS